MKNILEVIKERLEKNKDLVQFTCFFFIIIKFLPIKLLF